MTTTKIACENELGEVYFTATHDTENGWIFNHWTGEVTASEVIEAAKKGLQMHEEIRATKILNDNQKLTGSWDDANEWIAQEWMPRAIELGLRKFAHVISPDIFGALSAEEMASNAGEFEMRIFDNRAEAETWLRQA